MQRTEYCITIIAKDGYLLSHRDFRMTWWFLFFILVLHQSPISTLYTVGLKDEHGNDIKLRDYLYIGQIHYKLILEMSLYCISNFAFPYYDFNAVVSRERYTASQARYSWNYYLCYFLAMCIDHKFICFSLSLIRRFKLFMITRWTILCYCMITYLCAFVK